MTSSPDGFTAWAIPRIDVAARPRRSADDLWAPPEMAGVAPARGPTGWSGRPDVDEAYAAGHATGFEEGAAQARQRVQRALELLERVAESLQTARAELLRRGERDLECLALAVARKLVQREMAVDPAVLQDLLARALELMPAEATVELHLHPDDLAALAETARHALAGEGDATLLWVADPGIEPGGFLLDSPQRVVDGRADLALRNLYERFDQE